MSSNVYQTRKKSNSVYDGIQIMTCTWYTKYEFNDISEYTFPEESTLAFCVQYLILDICAHQI